jgi:multidrug efflux pump subunit AcrA (membrane-fusion protein)
MGSWTAQFSTSLPQDAPAVDLHPVGLVETLPVPLNSAPPPVSVSPRPAGWRRRMRWLLLLALVAAGTAVYFWQRVVTVPLPQGIVASNGRLEATEIDIAAKLAGRIETVLVQEGDFVERDQIVARMDTSVLRAQLREARSRAGA